LLLLFCAPNKEEMGGGDTLEASYIII